MRFTLYIQMFYDKIKDDPCDISMNPKANQSRSILFNQRELIITNIDMNLLVGAAHEDGSRLNLSAM